MLLDVELDASLRFGCREMPLGEILDLGPGDVVQLDRHIADPVDLIVGDKIVARGEVVLINGNFGLRITEVAAPRSAWRAYDASSRRASTPAAVGARSFAAHARSRAAHCPRRSGYCRGIQPHGPRHCEHHRHPRQRLARYLRQSELRFGVAALAAQPLRSGL